MRRFLVIVSLLALNQAALLPGRHGGLELNLQQQMAQTAITPPPGGAQQSSSSSSSSSSSESSESSESSQTSEDVQLLKEPQKLENMAGEQVDLSQESSEVLVPTSQTSSTNLQLSELVQLGQKAIGDGGHAEDEDDQDKAVLHTYHLLLSPNETSTQIPNVGQEFAEGGVSMDEVGGANEEAEIGNDTEADEENVNGLAHLSDDSMEGAHDLTQHLPGSHGDEAGLELAL